MPETNCLIIYTQQIQYFVCLQLCQSYDKANCLFKTRPQFWSNNSLLRITGQAGEQRISRSMLPSIAILTNICTTRCFDWPIMGTRWTKSVIWWRCLPNLIILGRAMATMAVSATMRVRSTTSTCQPQALSSRSKLELILYTFWLKRPLVVRRG